MTFTKKKPQYQSTFNSQPVQSLQGGGVRYANGATQTAIQQPKPVTPYSQSGSWRNVNGQGAFRQGAQAMTYKPVQSLQGGGVGYRNPAKPQVQAPYTPPATPTIEPRTQRFGEEQQFANQYGQVQNEAFDNAKTFMESQRPYYEQGIDEERKIAEARLAEIDRRTGQDIQATQDQADISARNLSKTKQMSDVQRTNKFANLGTLESTGAFGFTGQQTNADQQFNTDQANLEQERLRVTAETRAQSQQDRMTVEKQMNETVRQYKSELDKINYQLADNETARKQATLQLQEDLRQRLYSVADEFDARETARQKSEQDMALEDKKLAQNMELEKYKVDNKNGAATGKATQNILSVVDSLLGTDTKPITGFSQIGGMIPGNKSQLAVSQFNQLQGLLSLENRTQLQGSGAISDFEARTLERAASALSRSLSDEDFKAVLTNMRAELAGQNPQASIQPQGAFQVDGYIVEPI